MIKVHIEKLVFGGMGLARTDKGVLLVPGVLPGEIVTVTPKSKNKGVQIAGLDEVVICSDERRVPPCQYFGKCGGCDWLYINSQKQLMLKRDIFQDCFRRIGGVADYQEIELFFSPEFKYRMRVQLQIDSDGRAGFFKKRSNEIVQLTSCPLLSDEINSLLLHNYGSSSAKDKRTIKMVHGDEIIASSPIIPGITQHETTITVNKRVFKVNGGDFFQSNKFLNKSLGTWALPFIGGDFCVDVYGGSGFFSLMVSQQFKRGLLIESVEAQVKKACENFEKNGATHFKAISSDADSLLSLCSKCPDLVIVDPPRTGLAQGVRDALLKIQPKQILYVSCDIATQARDSFFLLKNGAYSISKTALFDCYPNTFHLESAILFESNA